MKNKTAFIISGVIVVAAGTVFYLLKRKQKKAQEKRDAEKERQKVLQTIKQDPVTTGMQTGLYNFGL